MTLLCYSERRTKMNKGKELCLLDAFVDARKAKESYERLKDVLDNAKKVFKGPIEEREKALQSWEALYDEVRIYDHEHDCKVMFNLFKWEAINNKQFEEQMRPQIRKAENKLVQRKKAYGTCMKQVSKEYDNFVNSISAIPDFKYVCFCLKQRETKKFLIEAMLKLK